MKSVEKCLRVDDLGEGGHVGVGVMTDVVVLPTDLLAIDHH